MNTKINPQVFARVGSILAAGHPTQTMKKLIANPLIRMAIAGAVVWLTSVLMAHGQDGKPVLVDQVADVTGSGMGQEGRLHQVIPCSDYRAAK